MGGSAESWQGRAVGGGSEVIEGTKFVIWEPDKSRKRGPIFGA